MTEVFKPTDAQVALSDHIRTCYMKGCFDRGYWTPVVGLSPDGLQYAWMNFGNWLMCDHHKEAIELSDLVDGATKNGMSAWNQIQVAFAKAGTTKFIPEREFAKLVWRES